MDIMNDNTNMIDTYRGVVYPNQLDQMGHMNVQYFVAKFDEATWHTAAAIGLTAKYFREQNRGMAALEQTNKFKAEVRSGELLIVKSRITWIREKTIRFLHIMYNAESMQEVASSDLLGVHMDMKIRKSCPFPASIIENCTKIFELNTHST